MLDSFRWSRVVSLGYLENLEHGLLVVSGVEAIPDWFMRRISPAVAHTNYVSRRRKGGALTSCNCHAGREQSGRGPLVAYPDATEASDEVLYSFLPIQPLVSIQF